MHVTVLTLRAAVLVRREKPSAVSSYSYEERVNGLIKPLYDGYIHIPKACNGISIYHVMVYGYTIIWIYHYMDIPYTITWYMDIPLHGIWIYHYMVYGYTITWYMDIPLHGIWIYHYMVYGYTITRFSQERTFAPWAGALERGSRHENA